MVLDPATMKRVAPDGETIGEIMFRGNITMKGYLKNPSATEEAFAGGWFHSGDLAVMHPDGYVQIKDRSKDVIISGGENISSSRSRTSAPPPGGDSAARGGAARPEMGRGAVRLHRAAGGRDGDGGGDPAVLPRADGRLQGAELVRVPSIFRRLRPASPEVHAARSSRRACRHDLCSAAGRHSVRPQPISAGLPEIAALPGCEDADQNSSRPS